MLLLEFSQVVMYEKKDRTDPRKREHKHGGAGNERTGFKLGKIRNNRLNTSTYGVVAALCAGTHKEMD